MIDLDRAVLYFGIAAVVAVATFNHVHANAVLPTAVAFAEAGRAQAPMHGVGRRSGPEWTQLRGLGD